ncbi:MAG: hypothetical protein WBX01_08890 [Nitrososphaeraceae archaeon]
MSYGKKVKDDIKKRTGHNYKEIVRILEHYPDIPAKKKILESAKNVREQLDKVVDDNIRD